MKYSLLALLLGIPPIHSFISPITPNTASLKTTFKCSNGDCEEIDDYRQKIRELVSEYKSYYEGQEFDNFAKQWVVELFPLVKDYLLANGELITQLEFEEHVYPEGKRMECKLYYPSFGTLVHEIDLQPNFEQLDLPFIGLLSQGSSYKLEHKFDPISEFGKQFSKIGGLYLRGRSDGETFSINLETPYY